MTATAQNLCLLSAFNVFIQNISGFPFVNLLLFSPIHSQYHVASKRTPANFSTAVAREYGEGVTGKAVSTYFERAKKDPNWDRSRSAADNKIGTPKPTPRKRGPKGSAKKATTNNTETDDEENFEGSPSKKGILNKTQGGRVEKHRNGRAKAVNYNEEDSADEEGGNDTPNVKMEALDFGNGHIVNGNGNGHAEIEDEELYADEEYI